MCSVALLLSVMALVVVLEVELELLLLLLLWRKRWWRNVDGCRQARG